MQATAPAIRRRSLGTSPAQAGTNHYGGRTYLQTGNTEVLADNPAGFCHACCSPVGRRIGLAVGRRPEEQQMGSSDRSTLPYYVRPGRLTSVGMYAPLLDAVPPDVAGIARVEQGLLIHEHVAGAYEVTLSHADRQTVHIRPAGELLARIAERDDRPLDIPRAPEQRVAGNCRHFTVLLVTVLRARGVPARARCGFGDYFVDGRYEDHWVGEYWNAEQRRWVLVDAQLDQRQRDLFGIDFDVTDVPRDRFLVAGEAWVRCRAGRADPDAFGLSTLNEAGWWWIAGNLMRDAAALGAVELLPWDSWGAMPAPHESIDDERMALFDELARLTRDPDEHADELRRLCADDRLRVPASVRNELRDRDEPL